jgi:membrane protease YdiL (CAAX protease family)
MVGVVMSLVVLASGSLIPAMLVHALVDTTSGIIGLSVLGGDRPAEPTPLREGPLAAAGEIVQPTGGG